MKCETRFRPGVPATRVRIPFILLFACSFLDPGSGLSARQQRWGWQNPFPQGSDVRAVSFVDSLTGYTVGLYGLINKTTDGGSSWTRQSSGTLLDLHDVTFRTPATGTAVGKGGTILRTSDGGATWYAQPSGSSNWLRSVSFTSVNVGTAVGIGGTILRTTNGGSAWLAQTSGTAQHLYGVSYADAQHGLAVGLNGAILRTDDGGGTWMPETTATAAHLYGVSLVNTGVGYVVGNAGLILKTTDGGISWTPQASGTTNHLNAVKFVDELTGMACGMFGVVVTTTDGGTTWTTEATGSDEHLYGMCVVDDDDGWVGGGMGTILHTTDGGTSWENTVSGPRVRFNAVHFADGRIGMVVGAGGAMYRTTDGGASWVFQSSGTAANLNDVVVIDANRALVVGDVGTILQTTNGGVDWLVRGSGDVFPDLEAISAPTWDTAFAVGDNYVVLRTVDGGVTWENKSSGVYDSDYKAVVFLSPLMGITGDRGAVEWTSDGGDSWDATILYPLPGYTFPMNDMSFPTPQKVFIAQHRGRIVCTSNAGADWYLQSSGRDVALWGIAFTDEFNGTVVGQAGTIVHTTDGGSNWVAQRSTCDTTLRDVFFLDSITGWAVGDLGTILHTGPETVDSTGSAIGVNAGWNIVSVPLDPDDPSRASIFPEAATSAFAYEGGYVVTDTLEPGRGYWLKFPSAGSVSIAGTPILAETIDVAADWNMIGSIGNVVPVSAITSIPAGIVTSNFFGFEGSYQPSPVIAPGKGYWVKASRQSQLVLSSGGRATPGARIRVIDDGELPPSPPGDGTRPTGEPTREFSLGQNSPNPFNPATTITFSVPVGGHVSLRVYDVVGRLVATLVDGELDRGRHTVGWDATEFPSGVYLCRLQAGGKAAGRKLLLLR